MRRILGSLLVVTLLIASGTALAAEETTTTTVPPSTTTTIESTTTSVVESTTTLPDEQGRNDPSASTSTTFPTSTTTATSPSSPSTTTTVTTPPPAPEPPDPAPEAVDFKVGHLPAPSIVFPLAGPHGFVDTFGAPRDGGRRRHAGIDIMARKGVPIVSVAAGVVEEVSEQHLAGQYVVVRHDNGWRSKYLHLDNDTPGTDDGLAFGYAKRLWVGMPVQPGTVLGFVGDSGNSENTVPHLHFGLYQPDGLPINPYRALVNAGEAVHPTPVAKTFNTEMVGHIDPDRTGFNAGIAVKGNHVYLGTSGQDEICPGSGVRIIDVTEPSSPVRVTAFAGADEFPGTATVSLWVGQVGTADFEGDLAVVGLQLCDEEATASVDGRFAGIAVYDVTDPTNPNLLSTVHSGDRTRGVHHVDVAFDAGRLLLAATVPQSRLDNPDALGDIRIYDLTDPVEVELVADWDVRSDGPQLLVETLQTLVGDEALAGQNVSWIGGDQLVVGHSAAGLVTLDVSRPSSPVFVGSTAIFDTYGVLFGPGFGLVPELNENSGLLFDGSILIQNDQRLQPVADADGVPTSWGRQSLYDLTDPAHPRLVSTTGPQKGTRAVDGEVNLDGFFSPQRSMRFGDSFELVTWLSEGVRVLDLANPAEPEEVAFFVPPSHPDPQGWWASPDGSREFPLAWEVASDGDLVYLSDVNSGLWIFRLTIPVVDRSSPPPE